MRENREKEFFDEFSIVGCVSEKPKYADVLQEVREGEETLETLHSLIGYDPIMSDPNGNP